MREGVVLSLARYADEPHRDLTAAGLRLAAGFWIGMKIPAGLGGLAISKWITQQRILLAQSDLAKYLPDSARRSSCDIEL